MKRIVLFVALVGWALAAIPSAFAHGITFKATATCVPNGTHTVTWTVNATNLNKNPKIAESNRAGAIPVGSAVGASTPFVETGLSGTGASATIKVVWTDSYRKTETATATWSDTCAPPPPPKCPDGYSPSGTSNGVLLCTKTTPPPPPVVVYGNPVCPAGSVQSAAGQGYVVCTITTPAPPAPPPVTITKYGKPVCVTGTTKVKSGKGWVVCQPPPKVVIQKLKYCPIPKPCPPGYHKLWTGTKWVCAVEGSG